MAGSIGQYLVFHPVMRKEPRKIGRIQGSDYKCLSFMYIIKKEEALIVEVMGVVTRETAHFHFSNLSWGRYRTCRSDRTESFSAWVPSLCRISRNIPGLSSVLLDRPSIYVNTNDNSPQLLLWGLAKRRRERVGEGDRRSGYDTYILYTVI